MQILRIKFFIVTAAVALLMAGCGGTGGKLRPVSGKAGIKAATKVTPTARKEFEAAVEVMKAGDKTKAESMFKELTASYPDLSGPYANLGLLYFHGDEIEKAQEAFHKAIEVNPESAVSYNHLAIINRGKGNFNEAKSLYLRALSINNDYAYAHLNIGILLDLYLGELESALDHYERYQQLTKVEDKDVKNWIIDIKRRIKRAKK